MNHPSSAFHSSRSWGECQPVGLSKLIFDCLHALPAARMPFYSLSKFIRGPLKNSAPRVYDVRLFDLVLRLLSRGNYCETTALFSPQFYDVEELQWVSESLAPGDVFVDVGGNVGLYSLITAKRCPKVDVYTVEPDPVLIERMQFNARNNGLRIRSLAFALSDYEGAGSLLRSDYQSGGNQLTTTSENSSSTGQSFEVSVTTLLSLCQANAIDSIKTLKIDIEGHEKKVLEHFFAEAPESLWPVSIIIERVHDSAGIVDRLINEIGYTLKAESARNVLLSLELD